VFEFDPAFFPIGGSIVSANDVIANIPTSGVNAIVLQTFDTDADPGTPFGAGTAANLIADRVTTSGAKFFVYFNSGLDVARLVYSIDLSDATADLKVLARLTNFSGQAGRDAMATLTASNFRLAAPRVPEPATIALFGLGLLAVGLTRERRGSVPRASARYV
jgi:hypothetical protein